MRRAIRETAAIIVIGGLIGLLLAVCYTAGSDRIDERRTAVTGGP